MTNGQEKVLSAAKLALTINRLRSKQPSADLLGAIAQLQREAEDHVEQSD